MNNLKVALITLNFIITGNLLAEEPKQLRCSLKGTTIYSINGVNVADTGASETARVISRYVDEDRGAYDEKSKVNVKHILNPSNGIINDILEAFVQEYKYEGKKGDPWLIAGAVLQGIGGNTGITSASLPMLNFATTINMISLYKLNEDVSRAYLSPENLEKSSVAVVNSVYEAMFKALTDKEKVILVPHSQGNMVANLATSKLSLDLRKFVGVLHVASPSLFRNLANSDGIKLYTDRIVSNSIMVQRSEPANYIPLGVSKDSPVSNFMPSLFMIHDTGVDLFNHGMIETYLSTSFGATPINDNSALPKTMKEIFKSKLATVAKKLADNCGTPDIEIEIPGAIKVAAKESWERDSFVYNSSINYSKQITVKAKDKNPNSKNTRFEFVYDDFTPANYINSQYDDYYDVTANEPEKVVTGVDQITDFPLPFADEYKRRSLKVRAFNEDGSLSSTVGYWVTASVDSPPSPYLVSYKCWLSPTRTDNLGKTYREYTGYGEALYGATDSDSAMIYMQTPAGTQGSGGEYQSRAWNFIHNFKNGDFINFYSSKSARVSSTTPSCNTGERVYE